MSKTQGNASTTSAATVVQWQLVPPLQRTDTTANTFTTHLKTEKRTQIFRAAAAACKWLVKVTALRMAQCETKHKRIRLGLQDT